MRLEGIVIPGKGIASGNNIDPETNLTNTIALQKPFFERAGVTGIEKVNNGTINLDITPNKFKIEEADYDIHNVPWTTNIIESFQLVKAQVIFDAKEYSGFIYYPLPSKIKSHPDSRIELLAPLVSDLHYGDSLAIDVADGKISLY